MYEYSHSIREVSFSPVDIMGNFFEPPYYSESQGPNTSVDYLKSMFTSIATNHEAEQEEGTMTWCAHIDDVQDVSDTSILIQSLTPIEKQKVKRFMFPDDQRRALLSILLQRTMIRQTFGVVDKDYELCRSKEGKPLVLSRNKNLDFKTWNFNVSHHGKYVCIVAHPHLLMGADIVDLDTRSNMAANRGAMEFIEMFEAQLTDQEVRNIRRQSSERAKYSYFYILWSLKEAFIKAIGQGLGYNLKEVEFDIRFEPGCDLHTMEAATTQHSKNNGNNNSACNGNRSPMLKGYAIVSVKNQFRDDWRLDFVSLDCKHVMSVARGPLCAALPTFQEQVGWGPIPTFPSSPTTSAGHQSTHNNNDHVVDEQSAEYKKHIMRLSAPLPAFERKSIAELFPQL